LERQARPRPAEARAWEAYRAAVASRDRAEADLSQAGTALAMARRRLQAAQEALVTDLRAARAAVERASPAMAEARSAYTRARLRADGLWDDLRRGSPRAFPAPLSLDRARRVLPRDTLF